MVSHEQPNKAVKNCPVINSGPVGQHFFPILDDTEKTILPKIEKHFLIALITRDLIDISEQCRTNNGRSGLEHFG
jgi:hypothetical protein